MIINPYTYAQAGDSDPLFEFVTSLIHFEGADGSTTFTDVIPGVTWSVFAGAVAIDTADFRFGASSAKMVVTSALDSNANGQAAFGTDDFTVETFIKIPDAVGNQIFFDFRTAGGTVAPCLLFNGGGFQYYTAGAPQITGSPTWDTNWHHVAVSRVSGTTRAFVDGVQIGSDYADSNSYVDSRCRLGAAGDSIFFGAHNGWYDEFRITKGAGRYTANFTIPDAAFPDN